LYLKKPVIADFTKCGVAHGIDDANSAIEQAIVMTKREGINHPNIIPK
jgi:hypothetical protein